MKINGRNYTFAPTGGNIGGQAYDILCDGKVVGWSRGNLSAARQQARSIARTAA